jgi:hypothetical protein
MRDMLPPIFQILTGLTFFGILIIGVFARAALKPLWGRLAAFSVVAGALGFFCLSQATGATSLGAGAEMFLAAGASFFAGALLVVAALFMRSREAP